MATLKQDTAQEQRVMNRTIFAKAGAVAYVIWGLLHLQAAWLVYTLGRSMPSDREFQGLLARFIHVDDEVSTREIEWEHEDLAGADTAPDQGGRED